MIVALGATAAKNLLGVNDSMASMRGRFYDFSPPRTLTDTGEPFECKLAVTYHPAFLLRDPRQKKEAWKDLQMVMRYLGSAHAATRARGQLAAMPQFCDVAVPVPLDATFTYRIPENAPEPCRRRPRHRPLSREAALRHRHRAARSRARIHRPAA